MLLLVTTVMVIAHPALAVARNAAPSIWGKPATYAPRDLLYEFRPHAFDRDGDRLTFSISNMPAWMWFDTRTGTLKGKPKWAQRNRTFANIIIRVSDGRSTRALPAFAITVGASGGSAVNAAPVIRGTPVRKAPAGQRYYFRPVATDANGDALSFSIVNKPSWARFSRRTGALSGVPDALDVRTYRNITVRVSDGKVTRTLRPFNLTVFQPSATRTVTLDWSPPVHNTDGSPLTDLAGYRVFYGTESGRYSQVANVPGASIRSVELQDLAAGTWYFAIRSVNAAGVTSDLSAEVRATLP